MQAKQDAYGQEVHDYFHGQTDITEIVERDDGYIDTSSGPDAYFAPYAAWSPIEQEAIQLAAGRVLDVGCGPGRVLLHLQAQGMEAVGIDNSPQQLETARELQVEFGLEFPLHLGNAEATPFPDASFDFAISEYGAAIWCDPYKWIPEAARLLRPGGRLHFLGNSTLLMLATPLDAADDTPATGCLERPLFGMHRFDWPDGSVEFHIPHGDMVRLLRQSGFEIEDLIEVEIPEGATTRYPIVTPDWARQWPCEDVWKVRKIER